jgi:DNA topoisomerase-3
VGKLTAHHAIIPTAVASPDTHLTAAERGIYGLIARRYVAQFYPPHEFDEAKIEVLVGGELFRAAGRQTVAEGWRVLAAGPSPDDPAEDRDDDAQALPLVRQGESVRCGNVTIGTSGPRRRSDSRSRRSSRP